MLRLWLADARRVAGGSVALLGYLLTRDRVEVGLAQVSAAAPAATRGGRNRYDVTVANASDGPVEVTLRIDIDGAEPPSRRDGRYATFSRRLGLGPRASMDVAIDYDWLTTAGFHVAGTPLPADDMRRGELDRPGGYAVSATLLDARGRRLDGVTLYQRLAP